MFTDSGLALSVSLTDKPSLPLVVHFQSVRSRHKCRGACRV